MIRSRWRLPEAPRPSRSTSRGTAALFRATVNFFHHAAALLAGGAPPLERDVRVDGFDLAVLARGFGRTKGMDLYSGIADIYANGLVDGADPAPLGARFGDPVGSEGGAAPAR